MFLDELPEFKRNVLEVMRQPLEDGNITVSRALGSINYPAAVMLVAAMNPCPCGFLTDPQKECVCTPLQIQRYRSRVSGPLLDRIDIQVEVPAIRYQDLAIQENQNFWIPAFAGMTVESPRVYFANFSSRTLVCLQSPAKLGSS